MNRDTATIRGFTLIELLVTISLIVLAASIALPSVTRLFTSGSDSQAYNLMRAQLTAARAYAIQNATYAGVHVQMADGDTRPALEGTCWTAVVEYRDVDDTAAVDMKFDLAPGFQPRRMPGAMAFGEISNTFVNTGDYKADNLDSDSDLDDFTSFTVVFAPDGSVTQTVDGGPIDLNANSGLFTGNSAIWEAPTATTTGVWAMTMFNYDQLVNRANRAAYLNEAGQFLAVNRYTGLLVERQ